ncbi:uncharacterized protein [Agelaius tricolor]|uniref:uncharacterized protein isoform X2 n=1 Tax=Agelaius tricolor TaxID=9191 RepID=UPI0039F172F3
MGREPGRAGCSPSGRPGFMAVPRRGKGLISRGPESRGRAGLAPWPSPLPRACGEGAVPALPSAPGPAVPPPHLPLGVPRRRPPGRGAAVPPALPGLGAGGRGAGTGRTLPCGVSALRDVPGLRAAHGLRGAPCEIAECRGTGLCRAGSQRCWGWGRLPLFGGGSLVPHSPGPGRAHPTQPRGVLGWGCPGRSLRTCRGPARCLSSGGGGGGGGGGSGAGTALEAVRAGQLQRDVSPSRNLRLCPQQVGDTGICRAAGIDCSHNPPPLPRLSDSSLMPGKLRRSRREVLGEKQWRSVEEKGSAQREQPKLTRSRTYESSCKDTEEAAAGSQGPPSPSLTKQNSSYRRAFGELAEQDVLLGCFSCAWQREMPYHGRLYVSSRHICFHSNLLLKDIKAVVPVASISALKKTNTALLVPNAISIRTVKGEKFLFVSLRQREATYQLLKSVCKHLQRPEPSRLIELRGNPWEVSDLEPVSPGAEHPGAQQPPRIPGIPTAPGSAGSALCGPVCPQDTQTPPWGIHQVSSGHLQMSPTQDQGRQRMRMVRWPCWFPDGCPQQRNTASGGEPTLCSGPGPQHFGPE